MIDSEKLRPCPTCHGSGVKIRFVVESFIIVECLQCGLVYLGNPPEDERLYDDYYGKSYAPGTAYTAASADEELRDIYSINEQRIARISKLRSGGKLFDIGCGRGHFLKTAAQHGYSVKGIDISSTAVEYARKEFGVDAETRQIDDLAEFEKAYDVVTMWHVLEHFSDPISVLRTANSLLAPNGLCFIEVPNLRSMKFILSKDKWKGGNHPLYHRTFFTSKTLRGLINEASFKDGKRLRLSYDLKGRNPAYVWAKRSLNLISMDAFLDYVAAK